MNLGSGHRPIAADDLPPGWAASRIGDACSTLQGGRLRLTKGENYQSSGFPAYSAAGQDGFVGVSEFAQAGVVLSAIGANCGRCFYASGQWTTLANVQAILPDATRLSAKFLFHRANMDGFWPRSGSAQPFIKPSDVLRCWIAHPRDVAEQSRIALVLDTVDEEIAKTAAVMAKLRQVRAGLLHDLLSRGLDAHGQLRDPLAHPEQFQDSSLGRIPRRWDVRPLQACTSSEITYGIVQAGPHVEGGLPYIRTGDMAGDRLVVDQMLRTTPEIAARFRRSRVQTGEIVCAIRATVGKVLLVPPELDGANLTQGTARIAPKEGVDGTFLLWALRSDQAQRAIAREVKGTTFFEITLADLRKIEIAIPRDPQEQGRIAATIQGMEALLANEAHAMVKLRNLKSGLMTDLLTGRVRVPETLRSAPSVDKS